MKSEKQLVQSELLFQMILEELEKRPVQFIVTGMSMWPFLCHGRDQVIIDKCYLPDLKKGDIVLYKTSDSHYILHRITCIKNHQFETTGDGNCYRDGYYDLSCIQAKVIRIIRKNKVIDCYHLKWKVIFQFWMFLFPIRFFLLKILKLISKIKSTV